MNKHEELTVLLVDDESAARNAIRRRLEVQSTPVRIIGEAANAIEAQELLESEQPDLIFLDIAMPGLDGLTWAKQFSRTDGPIIVFLTAYGDRALEAFETHAIDYLMKPVDPSHLERALQKATTERERKRDIDLAARIQSIVQSFREEAPTEEAAKVRLDIGSGFVQVLEKNICAIETAGDYICVLVGDATHVVRTSLVDFERRLSSSAFCRIHRQTVINLDQLKALELSGGAQARMENGRVFPISRRRLRVVKERIEIRSNLSNQTQSKLMRQNQ